MRKLLILGALGLASCQQADLESSRPKGDAVARYALGQAIPYQAQTIPDRKAIESSLSSTRALAWKIFEQVIQQQKLVIAEVPQADISVPQIFTWYSPEDIQRLMRFSFASSSEDKLKRGEALPADFWEKSQAALVKELTTLPSPIQKKWAKFVSSGRAESQADILGLTGLSRTLFSPDLISDLIAHYADLQDCFPNGVKPEAEASFKSCWPRALSRNSVMVKTAWLNASSDFRAFATDAESLKPLMDSDTMSWADHAQTIPVPDAIVKAKLNDQSFVLGGLHIVTKDMDDWLWISAWWSSDPNHDFGEDRPASVQALGAPWNQYKICAVSSYAQNPEELEALALKYPSLAAAYRSVLKNGVSWCSNPYIERGVKNQKGNCIGCHQFAGTAVQQEALLSDDARFPLQGTQKIRQDFPTDYIWSASQGSMNWMSLLDQWLYYRK